MKALKRVLPDLAIVALALAVYWPALHAGFIWDDDAHLTRNPHIVGSAGFGGIWTTAAATYYPLVLTTFWIQHAIWGLNPLPYHLVNVLMHVLCVILLRRVLLGLHATAAEAWFGALLWGIHPVQVESAAWITELKNTQSGMFYLLAILLFLKWRQTPAEQNSKRTILYVSVLVLAALALLSKTSTVMLPVVLLLCGWWLDGRWSWKTLKIAAPFFAVSAAAAAWTIWEQKYSSGALGNEWLQSLTQRVIVAGYAVWFYLSKLIWPHPLIFLYPRWNVDSRLIWSFVPAIGVVFVLVALWRFRTTKWRLLFFVFAYFLVSLFPVLDFFDVYFFRYSFVADHFQYLAAMGPLALLGVAVARVIGANKNAGRIGAATLVLLLGSLTAFHARIFHDNETLWRDTIAKNPSAWLAHNNLATIFIDRDDLASAIPELEITLKLNPHYAEAHANLADALFASGRIDEAITHFQLAIQEEPDYGRMHNYLGVALTMNGKVNEGISHIRRALEIDPKDAAAHENLGIALLKQGSTDEALQQFSQAVELNPNKINTRMRYGQALLAHEQYDDAGRQFSEVLRLSPNFEPAFVLLDEARRKALQR